MGLRKWTTIPSDLPSISGPKIMRVRPLSHWDSTLQTSEPNREVLETDLSHRPFAKQSRSVWLAPQSRTNYRQVVPSTGVQMGSGVPVDHFLLDRMDAEPAHPQETRFAPERERGL